MQPSEKYTELQYISNNITKYFMLDILFEGQ